MNEPNGNTNDSSLFVSKTEILNWLNTTFKVQT